MGKQSREAGTREWGNGRGQKARTKVGKRGSGKAGKLRSREARKQRSEEVGKWGRMEAQKWGGREEETYHSREVGKQGSEAACSRLAVSGDDRKAAWDEEITGSSRERRSTSPLVDHPALLSDHPHWQSAGTS